VPLVARAALALPALYVLSPLDLLPDFIPFIGHMDDAALFVLALDLASRLTPADVFEYHVGSLSGMKR
jgi:uncharacterized membrane protein YkvA (DUF1232 family)